ncbi:MAG: EamA/RhaT family transporter [Bacteroidetes bacterium]|nr:EamA/RhaT family transporter [Bacteroidota bacterium]
MKGKDDLQNWLLLGLLTLIWGTSYILIKKALITFSPVQVAALRVGLSFIVCIPFYRPAIKAIPRAKYGHLLFLGVIGITIPAFLFSFSQTRINSAVSGIINSLSPLFTVLTGLIFWQINTPRVKLIGVLIGLLGAIILVFGKGGLSLNGDMAYTIMPVIATLFYGINSNYVKKQFPTTNPLYVTSLSIAFIGPLCIVILFCTDFIERLHGPTALQGLGCVSGLAVFGTLCGWLIFYRLIQRRDALFAASVTYLVPIVAISWGLRDGETLNIYHLIGMALILVGVYFVSRKGKQALDIKSATK